MIIFINAYAATLEGEGEDEGQKHSRFKYTIVYFIRHEICEFHVFGPNGLHWQAFSKRTNKSLNDLTFLYS